VHHPIAPRALLHYHHNEDEYSYVLKGSLGALLGDDVIIAEPGFKIPRFADGSKSASTKEKHATPLRRSHKVCVMLSSSTPVFGDLFSENISKREEQARWQPSTAH
jgi:hypothetical protein